MILTVGDIVYYRGEYENCHGFKYKVIKTYNALLSGQTEWCDLEAVTPPDDLFGHYGKLDSIHISEVSKI